MSQKAYSCTECGTVNVFESYLIDGIRCMECGGNLALMGEIVNPKNRTKEITMKVNVDTKGIDQAIKKCEVLNEQLSKAQEVLSNPYFVQLFQIDEQFDHFNELVLKPGAKAMTEAFKEEINKTFGCSKELL